MRSSSFIISFRGVLIYRGRYRVGCQCCIGFPFDLAERAGVLATVKDKVHYEVDPILWTGIRVS
jgi:hypothetical protein